MGDDKNKRIDFVDLTKGVCIILVVMAHIGGAFEKLDYHSMIASFRMPLYFFISGIFFKSYEGLFGFFIRKINKLIVPFLFFYLSAFLLKYIVWKIAPGVFQLPVSWTELLVVFHDHALIKFNPPIWFLLALFNCNILFYLVHSLRDRKLGLMFALTLLIGIAGFYMGKHQIELPLYIDIAMTALPFYVAGFWIRRYNFFLFPHRFDKLIPLCILAALVVMYFTATFVGMRTNNYAGNIFQFWASAFAGIFMIMLFCKKFKKLPVISYLGRYSVITLGIHAPLLHFEYPVVSRFIHNHDHFYQKGREKSHCLAIAHPDNLHCRNSHISETDSAGCGAKRLYQNQAIATTGIIIAFIILSLPEDNINLYIYDYPLLYLFGKRPFLQLSWSSSTRDCDW